MSIYFFFFFQAEDGIRDYKVTGVQTCALPISRPGRGTASAMVDMPGVVAVAEVGIVSGGVLRELRHVERPDGNRAGFLQPLDRRRGVGRPERPADLGTASAGLAHAVIHI